MAGAKNVIARRQIGPNDTRLGAEIKRKLGWDGGRVDGCGQGFRAWFCRYLGRDLIVFVGVELVLKIFDGIGKRGFFVGFAIWWSASGLGTVDEFCLFVV